MVWVRPSSGSAAMPVSNPITQLCNGQATLSAYLPIAPQFDLRERRDVGRLQGTVTPTPQLDLTAAFAVLLVARIVDLPRWFDFGLVVFNNAEEQLARGTGPYFYLPKLESHEEARLWARAFSLAEPSAQGGFSPRPTKRRPVREPEATSEASAPFAGRLAGRSSRRQGSRHSLACRQISQQPCSRHSRDHGRAAQALRRLASHPMAARPASISA